MALVDPREFERGKLHASSYWLDKGDAVAAEAFSLMRLETSRFGFDRTSCLAWVKLPGIVVGLRFSTETGAYETSFVQRV